MTLSSFVARRSGQVAWAFLWLVFGWAFVGSLVDSSGCAHLRNVDQSCRQLVTPALDTKVSDALDLTGFEARLEQLVAEYSLCAINVAVQDLVGRGGAAAPAAGLQLAPAALSPAALRLERGRAWLAAHPSNGAPPGT